MPKQSKEKQEALSPFGRQRVEVAEITRPKDSSRRCRIAVVEAPRDGKRPHSGWRTYAIELTASANHSPRARMTAASAAEQHYQRFQLHLAPQAGCVTGGNRNDGITLSALPRAVCSKSPFRIRGRRWRWPVRWPPSAPRLRGVISTMWRCTLALPACPKTTTPRMEMSVCARCARHPVPHVAKQKPHKSSGGIRACGGRSRIADSHVISVGVFLVVAPVVGTVTAAGRLNAHLGMHTSLA